MYAVIQDSGKQFKVAEGDVINIDLREAAAGDEIAFDKVLYCGGEDGCQVGTPLIANAKVTGTVEAEVKGKKTIHFTMRRRKDSRRKVGHRQRYLSVRITGIAVS